jgi:VanZ family protein
MIAVLTLLLIVYGSLYPFAFTNTHTPILAWVWGAGVDGVRDAILNLFLYFPVGFLIGGKRGLATVVAISASCECLQSFDLGRVSSLPDLLLNTAGGALGVWAASYWTRPILPSTAVVGLALMARAFPFLPSLHVHVSGFRIEQAMFATVDWMAISAALESRRLLALASLVVPARMLILDQTTSLSEIAGVLVALIWRMPRSCLGPAMLASIVVRELMPLRFSHAPQAFAWIPFAALLSSGAAASVVFLSKLSLYMTALWLVRPSATRLTVPAFAIAAVVLILEWIQRYLPGRTPDVTEALLVLVAAAALSVFRTTTS